MALGTEALVPSESFGFFVCGFLHGIILETIFLCCDNCLP